MSTIVQRYCDKCKQLIPQSEYGQIWIVQILVTNEQTYRGQHDQHELGRYLQMHPHRQEWCRLCVAKYSLLDQSFTPTRKKDTGELEAVPTFEDKLREIIREEIEGTHE